MDLKLNRTSEYIFYIKSYFEYVYKFCLDYKNIKLYNGYDYNIIFSRKKKSKVKK